MTWKIKAIINDKGEDLYLGDIVNLGGEQKEVISINIINGMLIINGMIIDIDKIETDTAEPIVEDTKEETELKQLIKDANETTVSA